MKFNLDIPEHITALLEKITERLGNRPDCYIQSGPGKTRLEVIWNEYKNHGKGKKSSPSTRRRNHQRQVDFDNRHRAAKTPIPSVTAARVTEKKPPGQEENRVAKSPIPGVTASRVTEIAPPGKPSPAKSAPEEAAMDTAPASPGSPPRPTTAMTPRSVTINQKKQTTAVISESTAQSLTPAKPRQPTTAQPAAVISAQPLITVTTPSAVPQPTSTETTLPPPATQPAAVISAQPLITVKTPSAVPQPTNAETTTPAEMTTNHPETTTPAEMTTNHLEQTPATPAAANTNHPKKTPKTPAETTTTHPKTTSQPAESSTTQREQTPPQPAEMNRNQPTTTPHPAANSSSEESMNITPTPQLISPIKEIKKNTTRTSAATNSDDIYGTSTLIDSPQETETETDSEEETLRAMANIRKKRKRTKNSDTSDTEDKIPTLKYPADYFVKKVKDHRTDEGLRITTYALIRPDLHACYTGYLIRGTEETPIFNSTRLETGEKYEQRRKWIDEQTNRVFINVTNNTLHRKALNKLLELYQNHTQEKKDEENNKPTTTKPTEESETEYLDTSTEEESDGNLSYDSDNDYIDGEPPHPLEEYTYQLDQDDIETVYYGMIKDQYKKNGIIISMDPIQCSDRQFTKMTWNHYKKLKDTHHLARYHRVNIPYEPAYNRILAACRQTYFEEHGEHPLFNFTNA